jgi:hypothetical protein
MLNKIFSKFGYVPQVKVDEIISNYSQAIIKITNEKNLLKAEIASLKESIPDEKNLFDVFMADPIPADSEERKMYVSSVAGFYTQILKKKIHHMISVMHNILEEQTNDRDFDLINKGVIYSFREFLKWGDAMVNEQVANQNQGREDDSSVLSEDEKKSLQDVLN